MWDRRLQWCSIWPSTSMQNYYGLWRWLCTASINSDIKVTCFADPQFYILLKYNRNIHTCNCPCNHPMHSKFKFYQFSGKKNTLYLKILNWTRVVIICKKKNPTFYFSIVQYIMCQQTKKTLCQALFATHTVQPAVKCFYACLAMT